MRYGRRSYKNIYRTKRRHRPSSAIKTVVVCAGLAVLIFLGYCVSDPLIKLFKGEFVAKPTSSTASSSKSSSSSKPAKKEETKKTTQVKGVFLPKNYLSDTAALNKFITDAKAAGINLAVVDLKGEDGIINYNTAVDKAKGTEIVAKNAPDAAAAAKALSDAGITPAARICAFNDPVAPTVMRGSGVMYSGNHSINWIDPQNKRWLNPNSPDAQDYITSIATEAASKGYKQIFIDGLTFPTAQNADKQGFYGENMASKEQVLTNFVSALKTKVTAAGAKLTVMTSGLQAIGQPQQNIGQSQDIYTYDADFFAPNISPSLLGQNVSIGSSVIAKPDTDPTATTTAVAAVLKEKGGDKLSNTTPFIQSYTNKSIGGGNYKEYGEADIKGEITSLKNAGIESFILYNPEGNYTFSALK